ncbi:D-glycerate dehydrogenase [Sporosarcina sp. NCCP-2222]|uniref:2-hydroxyacid dehydrogenase n=1 Tax=Sporosarcina sp. NCCP-2222 TaxID=2935073 RepID=UPI00208D6FDF|nr:D-glycerate dehydrogenase [Sporosarcina sp. NCCP-2222]GKV56055.1 D-glycerate dehydrogenase [Sporosarcina sp. NCCP-2222]
MRPSVFITRKLPEEMVAPLREKFEVRMWDSDISAVRRSVLMDEIAQVDALWTVVSDRIDRELLETAGPLKVITNMGVGFNNIDINAAKDKGIIVTNTPDVLTETTADLAFALLLATARRLNRAERELRHGGWMSWTPMGFTGMDVGGKTLGIIGMGRIGEAVMRRASGFNMRVLYHNRSRKDQVEQKYGCEYVELEQLLERADHVVVLAPLTEQTAGMIGQRELGLMKKTATLISMSRGGIIDEDALYEALINETIWGAGLDVWEKEPVSKHHPLLTLPSVTALPHIGSATIETRKAMMRMNADAILDVLEGREPDNRVV